MRGERLRSMSPGIGFLVFQGDSKACNPIQPPPPFFSDFTALFSRRPASADTTSETCGSLVLLFGNLLLLIQL